MNSQPAGLLMAVASNTELGGMCPGQVCDPWEIARVRPGIDVVWTGVGKANAAGAVARAFDPARHVGVISLGIGGSLPGSGLAIGSVVVATRSVFSDEGVVTPGGFLPIGGLGFAPGPDGDGVDGDVGWVGQCSHAGYMAGRTATVSSCSGTDAAAAETATRTGAVVEAMEGAAVGVVAARLGARFCEVRVVSNTTGDRDRQQWDMPIALQRLGAVFGELSSMMGSSR